MNSAIDYKKAVELKTERHARILSTGTFVPENIVKNDDIIGRFNLLASDRAVQYSTGIKERRWDNQDLDVADFLAKAATQCLERAGLGIDSVDRIIYTRLLGDYQVPATSIGLLKRLNVHKGVPCVDISSACSGFIHALDMALRYIDSGDDHVLILGGGIPSWAVRNMGKNIDTRTVFLFGDGAAAMLLGVAKERHFLASYIHTNHTYYEVGYVPLGTQLLNGTKKFARDIFSMKIEDGRAIYECTVESAGHTVMQLLEQTGLQLEDIDLFVTSDQTTMVWEGQMQLMGAPLEKSVSMFQNLGNTVAAMSPLNLEALIQSGKLKRGMTVLMMAHGAGSSGGGVIFKY